MDKSDDKSIKVSDSNIAESDSENNLIFDLNEPEPD
jgi:hypothetical protein